MPYGSFSGRNIGIANNAGTRFTPQSDNRARADYGIQAGTFRRHEYTANTVTSLILNAYQPLTLLSFQRQASVPTASNNYQTPAVENGGRISDFKAIVKLSCPLTVDPVVIDIFEVQLSYFDATIWNTIQPTASPVTQDITPASAGAGNVTTKAIVGAQVESNTIANFRFVNHFIKHRGEVTIGTDGSGITEQTLIINQVPPKCVRSNMGMFWALYFKYSSQKNTTTPIDLRVTLESSFIDQAIARADQLPFLY